MRVNCPFDCPFDMQTTVYAHVKILQCTVEKENTQGSLLGLLEAVAFVFILANFAKVLGYVQSLVAHKVHLPSTPPLCISPLHLPSTPPLYTSPLHLPSTPPLYTFPLHLQCTLVVYEVTLMHGSTGWQKPYPGAVQR